MGLGGTLRRLRAAPAFAFATVATVALSLVLLAAGPIFSDAVAIGTLRRALSEAPAETTTLVVTSRSDVGDVEAVEELVDDLARQAFGPVDATAWSSLAATDSFEFSDQPSADVVDLVTFAWLDGVADQVVVVDGRLPDSSSDTFEVALDDRAANELGLDVDDELVVTRRTGNGDAVTVRVVGRYRIDDPNAAFWVGRDRISTAITSTAAFRTVTALTNRSSLMGLSSRTEVGLVAAPRFETIEPDDVAPLRRRLGRLPEVASTQLAAASIATASEIEVETFAASVLSGANRTLTVARSIVFAVMLQLAVLAAFALVLVAGLGVDGRQAESAMLRARGASATQLVAQALLDAALVVGPVAVVAPFAARWLVGLLDDVGPLADKGIALDPEIGSTAWVVVVVAAVVTIVLLAWPAYRAARARDASLGGARRRRFGGVLQRSGADVALVVVAVVVYWQLRTLDGERAASVRGRFGVDPLVIVAPTLGLAAGAFMALRVVPAAARWAERSVVRTRGAAPALTGWQLARRPSRYARSALLLIMAIAIGTFAVAYDASWTTSQSAQAAHEFGTDGRLEPNRRTGDSVGPLQLPSLIEAVDGVGGTTAVVSGRADLPGSDRESAFLAIDAGRTDVLDAATRETDLLEALQLIEGARSGVGGIALPDPTDSVELTVSVSDPAATEPVADPPTADDDSDETPPPTPPTPFGAALTLVVVDETGTPYRLDAGSIEPGTATIVVPVAIDVAAGEVGVAPGPLALTSIEMSTTSQSTPPRDVDVAIGPLIVRTVTGETAMVPLMQSQLVPETETLGFLEGRASVAFGGEAPTDGIGVSITTGSATFGTVPIIHTLDVREAAFPDEVPGAGTSAWLTASSTEVGDVIPVVVGRADEVRVRIVAEVVAIPTIDPASADGVVLDLPSLLGVEQRPGQSSREMTEYWFSVDPDVELRTASLYAPPVEAVQVELLEDRVEELVDNPAALATIGALSLGFVAAAAFAVVGFVVTTIVSVRERRSEFALLRAIGLTGRQHRRWMLGEQSILIVTGVVLGALLGWLLARLILPVVSLSQDGSDVYPPVETVIPWGRVVALVVVVLVGLVAGLALAAVRDRRAVAETLRAGGDQ